MVELGQSILQHCSFSGVVLREADRANADATVILVLLHSFLRTCNPPRWHKFNK
jgi:hypothetical protein